MKKDITLEDIMHDMREGFGEVNERFEKVNQRLNKIWTVQEGMSKEVDIIYDKVKHLTDRDKEQRLYHINYFLSSV